MTTTRRPEPFPRFSLTRIFLGALVAGVLVAMLVRGFSSRDELLHTFRQLDAASLIGPFAWSLIAFALSVARWRLVLAAMGLAVPFRRCLRAVLAAWPIAAISPARAGDAVRALALRKDTPVLPVLGSVALEKIFDVHSLGVLAAVGCTLSGKWTPAFLSGGGVLAFWACFFGAATFSRRMSPERARKSGLPLRTLSMIAESLKKVRARPAHIAGIVALSLVGWLISTAVIRALLGAAGQDSTWIQLFAAWPAAVLASALPISISGVGPRDGAFLLAMHWIAGDVDNSSVVAATLLYPLVTNWTFALLGVPFLVSLLHPRDRAGEAGG